MIELLSDDEDEDEDVPTFDREGHTFLASFARIHHHEQVFKSCHGQISTH